MMLYNFIKNNDQKNKPTYNFISTYMTRLSLKKTLPISYKVLKTYKIFPIHLNGTIKIFETNELPILVYHIVNQELDGFLPDSVFMIFAKELKEFAENKSRSDFLKIVKKFLKIKRFKTKRFKTKTIKLEERIK
jgi:hypothetical protein